MQPANNFNIDMKMKKERAPYKEICQFVLRNEDWVERERERERERAKKMPSHPKYD
jgi:hypothetical protein